MTIRSFCPEKPDLGFVSFRPLLLSLALVAQVPFLSGQSDPLHLRSGPAMASSVTDDAELLHIRRSDGHWKGRAYRVLQFDHTLSVAERARLEALGLVLLDPLRTHAWAVSAPVGTDLAPLRTIGLTGVLLFKVEHKIDPPLAKAMKANDLKALHEVILVPWPNVDAEALGDLLDISVDERGTMHARVDRATLLHMAGHAGVQWVGLEAEEGKPESLRGRTYHRVHGIGPGVSGSPGLDGTGVTVVVNDDGFVGPHIDFKGRTSQDDVLGDLTGTHGDMCAGIVAGAGNIDPSTAGMAPGADLIIRQYDGDLPDTEILHQLSGAVIFSSSYSNGCNAGYTETTQRVDQEVVDNPSILQVFSAGNEGQNDCGYGAGTGWGTISGGHKIGKHVIATANMTDADQLVASSSRGPSADGRIKPDIAAFGNGHISTAPDNDYLTGSGTSAAAPGIAGTAALLYQAWRDQFGNDPPSALIKAILLNTADDIGTTGPDYEYGWGTVNATRAHAQIVAEQWVTGTVDQGGTAVHTLQVPPGLVEVRTMLYWMDPAGPLLAMTSLVNDLDLSANDPQSAFHLPWALSIAPDPMQLAAGAFKAEDHLNNVEQVHVMSPEAGTWSFTVSGFDVPDGPQPYFLVHTFIAPGPQLAYPLGGEYLDASENHRFRWSSANTSDPVQPSVSLDSGQTWLPLSMLPSNARYTSYSFNNATVPDAMFRVEQGGYVSQSAAFSAMRRAEAPTVVLNCPDSASIVWDPVQDASSYIVHKLGDRYMDSVSVTANTAFTFHGLSAIHDDWFAVTAIGPQGILAERSLATQRPQQLVACVVQHDLAVEEFLSPGTTTIGCQSGDPGVIVNVRNAGSMEVQSFEMGLRLNDDVPVLFNRTDTIAPGAVRTIALPPTALDLQPGDLNMLKVWARWPNEDQPVNDTLELGITPIGDFASLPWSEDMTTLDICTTPVICNQPCPLGNDLIAGVNGSAGQVGPLDDEADWRVDANGTVTANTGPTFDHTSGTPQGRYLYLESSGSCIGEQGVFLTPCLNLPSGGAFALSFWYHMFGSGMGELHLDVVSNGSWTTDVVPPLIGDQGDQWWRHWVDLSAFAGTTVNVRFRGIIGTGGTSDMAIDDILVDNSVSIAETEAASLSIRPGVAPGTFVLQPPAGAIGTCDLLVFDVRGQCVQRAEHRANSAIDLDLRRQATGLYLLRWSDATRSLSTRVLRP